MRITRPKTKSPFGPVTFCSVALVFCFGVLAPHQAPAQIVPLQAAEPSFSFERGFYNAPFNLTISSETPGATIVYTTDGSPPSATNGVRGTTPVSLTITTSTPVRALAGKQGYETSPIVTHTYLFLQDVIRQPYSIPGYPNNEYSIGRGTAIHDYEMDPEVVDHPAYRDLIIDAMLDIPSMCLVVDKNDMFGEDSFYEGEAEKPASMEILYPDNPSENEQIDCGVEPHSHNRLKRSLRLSFKAEYGATKWDTDLFRSFSLNGDSAVSSYDRVVLRGGNNRSWARSWNPDKTTYTEDQFYRDSQIDMSGFGSRGVYVHLYINGLYWGLYNPVERPDDWFTSAHFGGDNTDWFSVSHGGVMGGDPTRWNYLKDTLINRDLSRTSPYNEFQQYLDLPHYCDYLLATWYIGMADWPENNWWGGNRNVPPTPHRYFAWDGEWSFGVGASNTGAWVDPEFRNTKSSTITLAKIWHAARRNDEFMTLFADRVYRHFYNGGALTDQVAIDRFSALNQSLELAIIAESARWGDAVGELRTRDQDWVSEINFITNILDGNAQQMIGALRGQGYYPDLDPPDMNQYGGEIPQGFQLILTNPNAGGSIYYTLDGSDPRLPGGAVAPSAFLYTGPVQLVTSKLVKARVKAGTEWSALAEALFHVQSDVSGLKITEIMYHPPDDGLIAGTELEFIELKNTSGSPIDLTGISFTDGIVFDFEPEATLPPGGFIVLASNAEEFTAMYGFPPDGEYTGNLRNSGERVALSGFDGGLITEVSYDDVAPWPSAADGLGFSLVPVDPNPPGAQDDPALWKTSSNAGGSPGQDDPPATILHVLVNEVVTNPAPPAPEQVELLNINDTPLNIGGWYLTDDRAVPRKYQFPADTIVPANGYFVVDETEFGSALRSEIPFGLSSLGEEIYLFSGDLAGNLTGYSDGFRFGGSEQGIPFGHYTNSVGQVFHPPLLTPTMGGANAQPKVGPVVISQIMYHPPSAGMEFLQLTNISGGTVRFEDDQSPPNSWRLSGVGFTFPTGIELAPGESLYLSGGQPDSLRSYLRLDSSVQVLGPYPGGLQNSGEELELLRPTAPVEGLVPEALSDQVRYNDKAPWPTEADGTGAYLERITMSAFGTDPANWRPVILHPTNVSDWLGYR